MYLHFDSVLCRLIYCDNFEWNELEFLEAYLRPGDVFVDVGANIGLYSLLASRIVGGRGRILSFEPCPQTFLRLSENLQLNRITNVRCIQAALSDRSGQMALCASTDGYDAWNSLASPIEGLMFALQTVDTISWDEYAQRYKLMGAVRFMKIDVEGWESRVLTGGTESFRRDDAPVLQVEFTEAAAHAAGSSCRALYRQLQGLGYQMFLYDALTRRLVPDSIRETYRHVNLIAAKDRDAVESRLSRHSCTHMQYAATHSASEAIPRS